MKTQYKEDWAYQCQECGEIKPDSEFEPTGVSEVCLDCEEKIIL